MIRKLTFTLAVVALAATASAQEKKVTVADFVGTWNIEVMSHQIALVIEGADGNKVTGTMMMMGRDTLLKGELANRTITLVGVKTEANGTVPSDHQPPAGSAPAGGQKPQPIVITLQDDGTIAGEMMTGQGPVKWTGEKLRTKKKS